MRLNPDGTPDATFSGDGRLVLPAALFGQYTAVTVAEVALQPDGKIVLAGTAGTNAGGRHGGGPGGADGTLDATFSGDGVATIDFFGLTTAPTTWRSRRTGRSSSPAGRRWRVRTTGWPWSG